MNERLMAGAITGNPQEGGGGTTAPSIIRGIQKIEGGQEAPHDGGAVLSKDVQMTPFRPEGLINPILTKGSLVDQRELMAFQVAMSTLTVATQAC